MAQMLLEKPVEYGKMIGYESIGYSKLLDQLRDIRSQINPEMHRILDNYETNSELITIIKNALPREGSYHRGSLVSVVSNSKNIALSAAAELFYWATAWLDDIADENTFRQNVVSPHKSSDAVIAMYASNALYGIVMRAITDTFANEPRKLAQIMNYFSKNFHVINRGQAIDALMAKKPFEAVSSQDYISLIEDTTGVDIASNIAVGAIVAELDSSTVENLYQFGLRLGTLAQIRDDVLDYCDTQYKGEYVIGKLPFRDIETKKKRLPLLLTRNATQKTLALDVYDRIENDFISPRKAEARQFLAISKTSLETTETLEAILNYWSDIRLFQHINSQSNRK